MQYPLSGFWEDWVHDRSIFLLILVWVPLEADFEGKGFNWDVIAGNPNRGVKE